MRDNREYTGFARVVESGGGQSDAVQIRLYVGYVKCVSDKQWHVFRNSGKRSPFSKSCPPEVPVKTFATAAAAKAKLAEWGAVEFEDSWTGEVSFVPPLTIAG